MKKVSVIKVLSISLFFISVGYLIYNMWESYLNDMKVERLISAIETSKEEEAEAVSDVNSINSSISSPPSSKHILPHYEALLDQNPDLAGWIQIENTVINYPVMQTPENEEYYLDRDFNKRKSKYGELFLDAQCNPTEPASNLMIYGHNMKDGKMFGALKEYKSKEYYQEHPYIQFSNLYEEGNYQIIAVFLSQIYKTSDKVFKYYKFTGTATQAEFDEFIMNIKALSLYDTGYTAEYGDQLITLSTCDYSTENGRLVVVGKKIEN